MTVAATSCLDPDRAIDFVERRLAAGERAAVEAHVAGCASCRQLLAVAASDHGVALAETVDESGAPDAGTTDEAYCSACGDSYPLHHDVCPRDGARLTKLVARPDPLIGRVFDDRYELRAALGEGGMGTVYRGWQRSVDREVAIKVIHPKLASDREAAKRFLRESRLASRLAQPNVVSVYDFGQTDDGILYIVMELVRGQPLARAVAGMRPLPLARILTIGRQLCDALAAAHVQGIVHRDLKPGNVVILDDPPGRDLIKVLDFGLAKSLAAETTSITHTRAVVGTPLYMPPEQVEGRATDPRADLYSLGCILYHLATGRPPFVADTVNAVLAAHVEQPAPPLPATAPPALAALVARLLAKDPADRPASAAEVRAALDTVDERSPAAASDAVAPVSAASLRRVAWIAGLSLVLLGLGGAVAFLAVRGSDRPARGAAPIDAPVSPPTIDASFTSPHGDVPPPLDAALVAVDAAPALDAAPAAVDAAPASPRPPADRPRPRPDAGVPIVPDAAPTIDFLPVGGGS